MAKGRTEKKWSFEGHCPHGNTGLECSSDCYYKTLLTLISKKHTMDIIRVIMYYKVARFNTILKAFGGSPKTLTDRLNELYSEGLIERRAYAEIPPRVEYSLTEKGRDMEPVFAAIRDWGEKWG